MRKLTMLTAPMFVLLPMCAFWLVLLSACSDESLPKTALETVKLHDFQDQLRVDGELIAAEITSLNVPGNNFERRTLDFMVPDGSRVEKDQVVARFSAEEVQKNLQQQERNLLRNAFRLSTERSQSFTQAAQIQTERRDIEGQLSLSERYSDLDASASWVSKNELLDKLQDLGLLSDKQEVVDWRVGHQKRQSEANSEVTLAARQSVQALVDRDRKSLGALELSAPHAGVFRLNRNWDGSKIETGGTAWAGDDFASLPNLEKLLARFYVPQAEAQGLAVGQKVSIRLLGTGERAPGTVTRVGASASVRSRGSPLKFVEVEARFDAVTQIKLGPGMAVSGVIFRIDLKQVLTVSNTSLRLIAEGTIAPVQTPHASAQAAPTAVAQADAQAAPSAVAQADAQAAPTAVAQADAQAAPSAVAQADAQAAPTAVAQADAQVAQGAITQGIVFLADGSERKVSVQIQGSARSVIASGLQAGEQIRVLRSESAVVNASRDKAENEAKP